MEKPQFQIELLDGRDPGSGLSPSPSRSSSNNLFHSRDTAVSGLSIPIPTQSGYRNIRTLIQSGYRSIRTLMPSLFQFSSILFHSVPFRSCQRRPTKGSLKKTAEARAVEVVTWKTRREPGVTNLPRTINQNEPDHIQNHRQVDLTTDGQRAGLPEGKGTPCIRAGNGRGERARTRQHSAQTRFPCMNVRPAIPHGDIPLTLGGLAF